MAGELNSWAPWTRHQVPGTVALPDLSEGGSGNDCIPKPDSTGRALREEIMSAPPSPDSQNHLSQHAAAGYAAFELKHVLEKIEYARNAEELRWVADAAFGSNAMSGRFCQAVQGVPEEKQYLELQRQLVQAELHDYLSGHVAWPVGKINGLDFRGPALWQVGHYLRHTRHDQCPHRDRRKKAAEARDALLKELTALFTHPDSPLAPIKAQFKLQTLEQWARFSELTQRNGMLNRGESGWLLGRVLLEVLPIIATESKTAIFAAKLSRVARQLLKLAHAINTRCTSGTADERAGNGIHHASALVPPKNIPRNKYPHE